MEIISWGMFNLGISDLPSNSGLKETVHALQERFGIRTHRREGALGHIYYTNSLADQVSQVSVWNTLCRPHHLISVFAGIW